jgi:peptidyl-prolyl cis-trans isomerase C
VKKLCLFVILAVVLAAGRAYSADSDVLARIGNQKITVADFNRIVSYYDEAKRKLLDERPQLKQVIVKRIVEGIVISRIARDKGFDKHKDVKEQIELLTNDFLASEYIKQEVVGKIDISEKDMKMYYKSHQDDFKSPEMVEARHILIKVDKSASEGTRKEAREKAEEILKKIKSGEDFAKLASKFSDDPTSRAKGGELGFFPMGRFIPEFEKVAFELKPGQVSDVVKTPVGYDIIKVEARKEPAVEPYDKVKEKVREQVFKDFKRARINDFVENAMSDAKVKFNFAPLLTKKEAPPK